MVTRKLLEKHHACKIGVRWFNANFPKGHAGVKTVIRKLLERDGFYWVEWLLAVLLIDGNYTKYLDETEGGIHIYESRETNMKAINHGYDILKQQ